MSVLVSFTVNLKNGRSEDAQMETLHLLCKCYPSNPERQDFLNEHNLFYRELVFYQQWIPELLRFQYDLNIKEIVKPNFAELVAGEAMDFYKIQTINNNITGGDCRDPDCGDTNKNPLIICQPFDNYIMMVDFSKTRGFRLADRIRGFDRDHALLAIEAYAKMHALGWAYKNHKKIDKLANTFPSFMLDYKNLSMKSVLESLTSACIDEAVASLKISAGASSELIASLTAFKDVVPTVLEICFDETSKKNVAELGSCYRLKLDDSVNTTEIPWKVVIHGDSHIGNLLFRYNTDTQKPGEIVLIDYQISRESCPVLDLIYCLYSSTDTEFRQNHTDEMIDLYYEKFNYFCTILKTETFPGFTLEELRRRFNRYKIFGLLMSLMFSAMFCKEKEEAVQFDSLVGMDQKDMFASTFAGARANKQYREKIINIVHEMHLEGVI